MKRFAAANNKRQQAYQQAAKTLADSSANSDHQFQNKANEVPGSSLNWNGTKKSGITELTVV